MLRYKIFFTAALIFTTPVSGHHSDAGLNMEAVIAFEGTVKEFGWKNPHVYVTVETTDEDGEFVEWSLQMGSVSVIARRGWSRDLLSAGDRVTVRGHPAKNGQPYAVLQSIEKEGGIILSPTIVAPDAGVSTSSLAGKWMADRSKLISYPGGFDGFFRAQLVLTEKGKLSEAQFDPLSNENPESTCIGRPTPAALVSSSLYLLEIQINEDIIVFRSEYFGEERV